MEKIRFSLILAGLGLLVALAGCTRENSIKNTPVRLNSYLVPFVGQAPGPDLTPDPGQVYPPPAAAETAEEPLLQANSTPPARIATATLSQTEQAALKKTPVAVGTANPKDPPTPTLFWPTLKFEATSTAYARPKGAAGQTLAPEKWKDWPVIPVVSDRARAIYKAGLAAGTDPQRFSKVGDCQVIRQYFMGLFDDNKSYDLGPYTNLERTISYFGGSFTRVSEAVRTGFNVASVLTPLYANPKNCKPGESPLQCEFRIWNPSIVIISMETWTAGRPTAAYENYLRQIVDFAIAKNVVPILATKADNLEGDDSINASIARVAADYDIPLWNFRAATWPLPDNGLLEDRFHLTNAANHFGSATDMEKGWPVRNLTALQALTRVWQEVTKK